MPQLRLKDYLVIVGGILLLALSLSFAHVNPVDGAPPGPSVTVVNTPLPVTLQGTSSISGTVAATQSGTWNVGITGSPNVNVMNTPLPIAETARKAVNHSFVCSSTAVGCGEGAATEYVVPTGYQLVIDYASIAASNLPVGDAAVLNIVTTVNSVFASFQVPQSQMVKLYADAGTTVQLSADRASNVGGGPNTSYFVSFTGHLVPLP